VSAAGGTGGGGSGGLNGSSGTANTGGGGGGARDANPVGNGGSGIVVLRYPAAFNLNIGAGLTANTATIGDEKVTTFTAGTDTVTLEAA
jgi:hypothetical protein